MRSLILFSFLYCLLINNVSATDHFDLHWINYTQNTYSNGQTGHTNINVIGNIGDSVTLRVLQCCGYSALNGPWLFNGDTISGTLNTDSIHIVISQAGTYSVAGDIAPYYLFDICLPPVAPPPAPINVWCWTSPTHEICPGSICHCAIIGLPVLCATSYNITPPAASTIISITETDVVFSVTSAFTSDTVRATASNNFGTSPEVKFYLYCPGATGVQNYLSSESAFTISPNPASDEFTISSNQILQKIEIFNLPGERVYHHQLPTSDLRLPTSIFPNGLYIIKAYTGKGVFQQKLVINH